ncbi:acyl-CoA thioesterase [Kitasatospora sp. NPDC058444]|uniref:acyl-CoA thioesterase n=1 Tax=Kitasatospora sp. NPDC058444 TaxID=3346504 RepID=UPI00365B5CBE
MTDLTEQRIPAEQEPSPATSFAGLLEIEQLNENTFRGQCHEGAPTRAFGGHVAAQALVAAGRTCKGQRAVHSLHSYFLLPADPTRPLTYEVERLREGVTYSARRVRAVQDGHEIFSLTASFKRPESTDERHRDMPPVPGPDSLPDALSGWPGELREAARKSSGFRDLELRFVPSDAPGLPPAVPGMPQQFVWLRTTTPLPDDDPLAHAGALTYLADLTLASTAGLNEQPNFFQRPGPPRLLLASLDHTLWFHRPFRADEWLLFAQRSPTSSDGRGLTLGEFYDLDGRLVASAAQEALVRRLG